VINTISLPVVKLRLAAVTVQPIRRIAPDAAILFSDILVIPQAMGIDVEMKPNFGPYLPHPIRTIQDVENVIVRCSRNIRICLIKLTKMLNDEVPLIGFAGSGQLCVTQ
jgi:uroporphyrinogen decarboxylase